MIRVYLAGAYSATNVIDVLRNIGRGQSVAAELFRLGYAPFCPWFDKDFAIRNWNYEQDAEQFRRYSMTWLNVSDVLLLVPNFIGMKDWQQSIGTLAEIERAKELEMPVLYSVEELLKYFPVSENNAKLSP